MFLNAAMAQQPQSGTPSPQESAGLSPAAQHQQWLQAVGQQRDKKAFAALFEHFAPRVKSFLMKGGMDEATADELAQETMLTIWHKAEGYQPGKAAASTWIFTIARNKKIDLLRKNSRYYSEDLEKTVLEDDSATPIEETVYAQEQEILTDAIETLPEQQAELLRKSFFEDKSHAEIAEEMGVPLGTVKSRIRLALERLRKSRKVKALW